MTLNSNQMSSLICDFYTSLRVIVYLY